MKILVTGSAGFIGLALKTYLEGQNISVVPFDIRDAPKYDVRDLEAIKRNIRDVEGIIHLAAVSRVITAQQEPLKCVSTNIGGTLNVLESARTTENEKPWVIFGSSREVFGEPKYLPVTEVSPKTPINIYGISKITGEHLCEIYSKYYNLKIRILRFSNVYTGINDHLDRVIPKFILQALKDENMFINGTGEERFDFTYISDVVKGIWGCIEEIRNSNTPLDNFNLSIGKPVSLKELAEIIVEKTNSNSKIMFNPPRNYDVNHFYASPKKAAEKIGFEPSISIEEGINLAINELKRLI